MRAFRANVDADLAALLHEEMRECLRRYEARKQEAGALDFLDLLIKARDLVRDNQDICREFRERFRDILVDEFQDTDPLQADLLRSLAGADDGTLRPGALFIVGDPKQSIYRFRRADVGAYRRIADGLGESGAIPVTLQTSYRSVPAIQHFVNAAFRDDMNGDRETLQADYVPLLGHRADTPEQPAVVALPVPRPYGKSLYGPPQVTQTALNQSQPPAIAAFVSWLLSPECTWTVAAGDARRKIVASDICLLFRRFLNFGRDITRDYVEGLEARGIPHLLVGGKTFHEREEVDAIRTALTAIEWPEDELSVYAALHGPLFAIGEEELLEYHAIARVFHPYRIPDDLPDRLKPVAQVLRTLRELHAARNHRPVADTIGRLIAVTRAHAGFVLWRGGEQALANVLHISDLARRYELEGGLSFRGFVDTLHDASGRADSPEAPILEEGSNGVRLMTVHKAKGLEFPIVVLADIACKLSLDEASRYLDRGAKAVRDSHRRMVAARSAGAQRRGSEARRGRRHSPRLCRRHARARCARGARRRRRPLHEGLDSAAQPRAVSAARAVAGAVARARRAVVQGQADDHGRRARRRTARRSTRFARAPTSSPIPVRGRPTRWCGGIRCCWRARLMMREVCAARISSPRTPGPRTSPPIARDTTTGVNAAGSRRKKGSIASAVIATATEVAGKRPARASRRTSQRARTASRSVLVEDASQQAAMRPSGKRFGTLVHALLATLPLDATTSQVDGSCGAAFEAVCGERSGTRCRGRHCAWLDRSLRGGKPLARPQRPAAASGAKRRCRSASMAIPARRRPSSTAKSTWPMKPMPAGWSSTSRPTSKSPPPRMRISNRLASMPRRSPKATGMPATGVLLRV